MQRPYLRTAITYLVVALAWVLASDRIAAALVADAGALAAVQSWKAVGFILASSLLIGITSFRQHRARNRLEEEKRASDRRALQEYETLLGRIAVLEQRVGTARHMDDVCRALQAFVHATVPLAAFIVSRVDPEAKVRIHVFAHVDGSERDVRELAPSPLGTDAGSRAVLRHAIATDPASCADEAADGSGPGTTHARGTVALPVLIDGGVLGVVEIRTSEPEACAEEHAVALEMAANLLAIAFQNEDLWRREHETRREVEASEARFRSLVQNSSDVIRLMDRNGAILYQSPAIERLLGRPAVPSPAERIYDDMHPGDVPRVKEEFARSMEAGRGESLYRMRHANGEWRWFESVGVDLLEDPHVGAMVVNSRDVTERIHAEEALREERAFSEAIINSFPGIFYVLDETGAHHQWNRNYARLLGYDDDEMARLHPQDLYEGSEKALVASRIRDVFTNGRATVRASIVTKDGSRVPFYLTGERVSMGGRTFLAGVGVDLSEIHDAQARIEELARDLQGRLDRITALHEVEKAITATGDLDRTLDVVLTQITRRLRVDAASVLLYKPATQTLRFGVAKGLRGSTLRSGTVRLGEDPAGVAALRRERVVVEDARELTPEFRWARQIEREDFSAYVAVPLVTKGKLQGVLELFHRTGSEHDEDWYAFLDTLATQVAIALDNANMFESLERSNEELRLAYDTTIEGWARALDLKDEETEGHSRRVTEMTVRLAEHLGMTEEEIVHVRRGALLHDIGKMGIPDGILLKPGKLDPEEWALMQRHTTYGFELLSPIPFLRPALDIPYCHHERWDGSGYPRGLKGEQIPLAARLFSVVDVFDALTSDRPYRKAWSVERALAHIRGNAGSQFDPEAVAAFLKSLEWAAEHDLSLVAS